MLIALKEKCKVNTKCLPSATERAKMALGNETSRGGNGKTKTESVWTPFSFWARSVKCGKLEPDDQRLAEPTVTTFLARVEKVARLPSQTLRLSRP